MGIFDFFKKKKEEVIEIREIRFNDIGKFLDDKVIENKRAEKRIFEEIKNRIDFFVSEIEEKIIVLEEIDVESKKEHGRAKILVKQGLESYINLVNKFMKDLLEIKKEGIGEFVKKIDKLFFNFEKSSFNFYQRATYLIGDEIAAVRIRIKELHKEFSKLFNENIEFIELEKFNELLKQKFNYLEEINRDIGLVNEKINDCEKNIKNLSEKRDGLEIKIEKAINSDEYTEGLKLKDEIKKLEREKEIKIMGLKEVIDFKALSNLYHSSEKKMEVIKSYRDNFLSTFKEDSGKKILELISGTSLENNVIDARIDKVEDIRDEIVKKKSKIKEDIVFELNEKVKELSLEREKLVEERGKSLKRMKGLKEELDEVCSVLKIEVERLGAKIID
ncbi:MAG: hypothetical protein ABIF88_01200 [archaeon]